MAATNLSAQKRTDISNSALKTNRKKGNIPGIFYYKGSEPIPVYVKDTALNPFIYTSEVYVISLQLDGAEAHNCIIKDIQFDPVSDKAIHFDLLGISENETIKLDVPLVLVGSPVGVKEGGIVQHSLHKVEVECLPHNIPAHIDIHIEHLKIGDAIHIGDIEQKNFEILDNKETIIVAVVPPTVEKTEVPGAEGAAAPAEGETAEPEVISKGKKEEEE
ncbi:MAG: 50S ribosomal protein L25 [Ignavibacteriae bacterium]|nr:MAG: 50S ribosomal protein L25 [Ignavibacteriota bacterium]